jgi:flagellar protein FlaJ
MPITRDIEFPSLERKLMQADIKNDLDFYLSKYLFFSIFSSILVFIFGFILITLLNKGDLLFTLIILSLVIFFAVIVYAIIKPYLDVGQKVASIKTNLALAILGMSSIAESGAPPEAMFHTSSIQSETPYIKAEFNKITNYMDNLGLSLLESIDHVCEKTPSIELKKFLSELKSNIESGGDLSEFMRKKAEHAQFTYHLMLDNMNKRAELFGDIYSAVIIAGPLFLFSTIMLLGMIGGGGVAGMSMGTILALGIFAVIPVVNIIFIIILQLAS